MQAVRNIGWLWSVGAAVALGCGGGEGTGGTLQLVQTVPADMAIEVPTDVVVTAEFDVALNEATVTTSSFQVRRDGGTDVEGDVAVDGAIARFTPASTLAPLSDYTATLTTGIESVSGETLDASRTWSFRTRDGQWGEPVLVETRNAGDSSGPQVALDPKGNAVAVWRQFDVVRPDIWANRFTPSEGWGDAERIETYDDSGAFQPQVDLDANGNAVPVWLQSDGVGDNVWANRFTPSTGWGFAERIATGDPGAGSAEEPQVDLDSNGNALAVWHQGAAVRPDIWANRFK